jgi:hypothetical protein
MPFTNGIKRPLYMELVKRRRYDLTDRCRGLFIMSIIRGLIVALAWLGRQGTGALAASIFVGLAIPSLAAYVKPYLGEIVFVLLLFSYLRTDPSAFRRNLKSPGLPILASLWLMIAAPLLFGAVYASSGIRDIPALYTIMILHVATAPITSSAAFAALMGLDVALSLITLIVASAISPISTVAFSYLFLGNSLFSPVELGLKLFFFFASSGAVAYLIRRIAGQEWITRQSELIDGLNVIAVFIFAVGAMDGVLHYLTTDPLLALKLLVLVIVVTCALAGLSLLVFLRAGAGRGLVIGLLSAFRNLGVIMAALGSTLPDIAWLYFALAQFPIFLMPALLKPLAKRLQHAPIQINVDTTTT